MAEQSNLSKFWNERVFICPDCHLRFDNSEMLRSHREKFCTSSLPKTINKLEMSYKNDFNQSQLGPSATRNASRLLGLSALKEELEMLDENFSILKKKELNQDEYDKQIEKRLQEMKDERAHLKVKTYEEGDDVDALIAELDTEDFRKRQYMNEKDDVSSYINLLNQRMVSTMELEKKKELEKILVERDILYERELNLLRDIKLFRKQFYADKQMEFRGKALPVEIKFERRQQFRNLRSIKEDIDMERQRLIFNFDKIRSNQLHDLKRMKAGVSRALNILSPFMNNDRALDKIKQDSNKLNDLKRSALSKDDIFKVEPYEIGSQLNVSRYVMDTFVKPETQAQRTNALTLIRTAIAKDGVNNGLASNAARIKNVDDSILGQNVNELRNSINDIQRLKRDTALANPSNKSLLNGIQRLETDLNNQSALINNTTNILANPIDPNASSFMRINKQHFIDTDKTQLSRLLPADDSLLYNPVQSLINIKSGGIGRYNSDMSLLSNNVSMSKNNSRLFKTVEEKQLADLKLEEERLTKTLASYQYGSPEYQGVMNKLNDISKKIKFLDKTVLEQRTQRTMMRKSRGVRFGNDTIIEEEEHNMSINEGSRKVDVNRTTLRDRVKLGGTMPTFQRKYSPFDGFSIHFDFLVDIPKKYESARLTYGVYAIGEVIVQPKSTDTHFCQDDDKHSLKVIFGEKHTLYDVPVNSDALLIIEIQFSQSDPTLEKTVTIGWTAINIFDLKPDLMRGRFKIPMYKPPTDITVLKDNMASQPKLQYIKLFMRITHPGNDEIASDFNLHSDTASLGYTIPAIHTNTGGAIPVKPDLDFDVDAFKEREKQIFDLIKDLMDEEKQPLQREIIVIDEDTQLPPDVLEALKKKMEELGMKEREQPVKKMKKKKKNQLLNSLLLPLLLLHRKL